MSKSLFWRQVWVYAFALFSMFFGSGNLVFPLQLGQQAGGHWFWGFLGLLLTGILLPFAGLFVIQQHRGSYRAFFSEAGVLARFFLPLFALSLLGSFGVVPRCITVAHGGLQGLWPALPLPLFSGCFCLLCFVICLKEHWVIQWLGKWLTPTLLFLLAVLIGLGLWKAPALDSGSIQSTALSVGGLGVLAGYRTMDLFAAFFFSSFIFLEIQKKFPSVSGDALLRLALIPSSLAALLLALIYGGFVFLGARYAPWVVGLPPERMLPVIADQVLGRQAVWVIGAVVTLSCLTTAVALTVIYARYFQTLFQLPERTFAALLGATILASFFVSLLDFRGIARFLNPLLEATYPSLIVLTLVSLLVPRKTGWKRPLFYLVLLATLARLFGMPD